MSVEIVKVDNRVCITKAPSTTSAVRHIFVFVPSMRVTAPSIWRDRCYTVDEDVAVIHKHRTRARKWYTLRIVGLKTDLDVEMHAKNPETMVNWIVSQLTKLGIKEDEARRIAEEVVEGAWEVRPV